MSKSLPLEKMILRPDGNRIIALRHGRSAHRVGSPAPSVPVRPPTAGAGAIAVGEERAAVIKGRVVEGRAVEVRRNQGAGNQAAEERSGAAEAHMPAAPPARLGGGGRRQRRNCD